MSTLYRLKAYFGMVPPEDMDAYAEAYGYGDEPGPAEREPARPRYQNPYRRTEPVAEGPGGHQDDLGHPDDGYPGQRAGRYAEAVPDPRPAQPSAPVAAERRTVGTPASAGGARGSRPTPVHGSLAMEAVSAAVRAPEPVPDAAVSVSTAGAPLGATSLGRITTVHPRSYNEARTIGERYRDGIPVIINLTELDDAAAKRLVDFAAGLAFALRGSIDKITSRVFLLSPAGVDVSAEERRKLAERGFFGQD